MHTLGLDILLLSCATFLMALMNLFQDYSMWVLCRVYEREGNSDDDGSNGADLSCLDEVFLSLDDLDEITN